MRGSVCTSLRFPLGAAQARTGALVCVALSLAWRLREVLLCRRLALCRERMLRGKSVLAVRRKSNHVAYSVGNKGIFILLGFLRNIA